MNSFPENAKAFYFIGTSLELLQKECPPAYEQLCSQMAGRRALLTFEGEPVLLTFSSEQISVQRPDEMAEPSVYLTTNWATILDLVDARLTIIDAILSGQFDLHGDARELARFYDATRTYLRGGVRCPSFPALLDDLRFSHLNPVNR